MQQTSIYTLKSQNHILGDDISALRDGITGSVTVGITSPGDYDKFYITSTTGTFSNAFFPSNDIYDNVLNTNVPDKTSVLGIVNTYKLTKTKASLKINCKTVRPFTFTKALFDYEAAPSPLLTLYLELFTKSQTNLLIKNAHLNLRMMMTLKTIPMIIGADFMYAPEGNSFTQYQIITIIDPGYDQVNKRRVQKVQNPQRIGKYRDKYNAAAFTGAETIKCGGGERVYSRGIYFLDDPFSRINQYCLQAGYNNCNEVKTWNPTASTKTNSGVYFPVTSVDPTGDGNTTTAASYFQAAANILTAWDGSVQTYPSARTILAYDITHSSSLFKNYYKCITTVGLNVLFSIQELGDINKSVHSYDLRLDAFLVDYGSYNIYDGVGGAGSGQPDMMGSYDSPMYAGHVDVQPSITRYYTISTYDYLNRNWGFKTKDIGNYTGSAPGGDNYTVERITCGPISSGGFAGLKQGRGFSDLFDPLPGQTSAFNAVIPLSSPIGTAQSSPISKDLIGYDLTLSTNPSGVRISDINNLPGINNLVDNKTLNDVSFQYISNKKGNDLIVEELAVPDYLINYSLPYSTNHCGGIINYKSICTDYLNAITTEPFHSDVIDLGSYDITASLNSAIQNQSVTFDKVKIGYGNLSNQHYASSSSGISVKSSEIGNTTPIIYGSSGSGPGIQLLSYNDLSIFVNNLFDTFRKNPEYYSASLETSYIDCQFNFSNNTQKSVIFPLGSIGITSTNLSLNQLIYISNSIPRNPSYYGGVLMTDEIYSKLNFLGYIVYNQQPSNGVYIDYHYNLNSNGTNSTLPYSKTISLGSLSRFIQRPPDNTGRYFKIVTSIGNTGISPYIDILYQTQQGLIINNYNNYFKIQNDGEITTSIDSIGITGFYTWTGLTAIDVHGATVPLTNNIELIGSTGFVGGNISSPINVTSKYVSSTQASQRHLDVSTAIQNLITVDDYTQDVNIPIITYLQDGNFYLPLGSTGITFQSSDGFDGNGTFTISYYYGNDSLSNTSFSFGDPNGITYRTNSSVLKDVNQLTTKYTFDINTSILGNTLNGSDIISSFIPYGQTGSSGPGPNLPLLGLTRTDLYSLYPDIYSFNLILYYYYGDALYNQYYSTTISPYTSLNLSDTITQTNYILDKAQRYFTLTYAQTQQPLYIVNIASNKSGYTFTEDPITIRTYDYNAFHNYKLLKLPTSGFMTGSDVSNLVDINNEILNRQGILFEEIPGKYNNFDDGSIDKFLQKNITTINGEDFMTRLILNEPSLTGSTGYLNQFFVFNNVLFSGGYTGTLYAFATSITGSADPRPDIGITGLYVSNGFRVDSTPKFITGTSDYTNGFTQEIVTFDFNNYITNEGDELTYNHSNLDPNSTTFKMRVLLNSKSDKYDSTQDLPYTDSKLVTTIINIGGISFPNYSNVPVKTSTATFYGLSPNTTYNTSFLTYNEGATHNTSQIQNFKFTTGVTGIVFDGNFSASVDPVNDRKYNLTISNLYYRLTPGKISKSLVGNTQYQLLLDMGDPDIQFIDNTKPLPLQARCYYDASVNLFISEMPLSVIQSFTKSNIGGNITIYDGTQQINLSYSESSYITGQTGSYFYVADLNNGGTTLYSSGFCKIFFCMPSGYTRPADGTIKIFTTIPFSTTGKYIIPSITDYISNISITNLKRGKTYYPKLFMQLISDTNYKTNCLFTDPITIPLNQLITVEYSNPTSYLQPSIIRNLQVYEEGYYEDISCITRDSAELAIKIIDPSNKFLFAEAGTMIDIGNGTYGFSIGFPGDFSFGIETLPSTVYDNLSLVIAHVDESFRNIDNHPATDPFPGITGTCDSSGKILTFGSYKSNIYNLNNMYVLAMPTFTTPAGQTGGEVFQGIVSIVPHLFNTQISVKNFNYYKYDPAYSYCIKYGYPQLNLQLTDPMTGATGVFTQTPTLLALTYQDVNFNIPFLLTPNTKYTGYIYFTAYDQRYALNIRGTQTQTISFTTPVSEQFKMPDINLTPLINSLVVEVGRTKNIFSGQSLELLNQPLEVQVFERESQETSSEFLNGFNYFNNTGGVYDGATAYNVGDVVWSNTDLLTYSGFGRYLLYRNEIAGPHGPIPDGSTGITALNGNPTLGYGWSKVSDINNSGNLMIENNTTNLVQRQDGTTGYFMVITGLQGNKTYQVNIGIKIPGLNYQNLIGVSGSTAYFNPLHQISTSITTLPNKVIPDLITDVLPYDPSSLYSVGKLVSLGGQVFECIVATNISGVGPFGGYLDGSLGTTIHWKLISTIKPGLTGSAGFSGPSGGTGKFLSRFHYQGSAQYLTDGILNISGEQIPTSNTPFFSAGNVFYYHDQSRTQINNVNGIYIDKSMYNPNNFLTYQPQISVDKNVFDQTNPTYFDYNAGLTYGSLTGLCSVSNITHSSVKFNLSQLSYNVLSTNLGLVNLMLPDSSIYIVGNTGSYTKEIPLTSLYYSGTTGYGLTGIIDNLAENTTFSDFKIYYKPYAAARYTDTYISIPSFTTPKGLDITYDFEVGINNIYLVIKTFSVDGIQLPQDTFFTYSDQPGTALSTQAFNFFFFLKGSNIGDPTKTTPNTTNYISIKKNSSYKVLIAGASSLTTYDALNMYYKYIDVSGNTQVISKILNLT